MNMEKNRISGVIALFLCMALCTALLSGCGSSKANSEKGSKKADSLNIMIWEGTWSEEMFEDFTEETGIKVNISYIDNTDTLLSKMIEGNAEYDLID